MKIFRAAGHKWWNKPLVLYRGKYLPAELAVLGSELMPGENGVWLNSMNMKEGVMDLEKIDRNGKISFRTVRMPIPRYVSDRIRRVFGLAKGRKGCPDLVIWNDRSMKIRFVEVKCPHWDKPSKLQRRFMEIAASVGITVSIAEWEIDNEQSAVDSGPVLG